MDTVVVENKHEIKVYTTPGCEGCRIMLNKINDAVSDYETDTEIKVIHVNIVNPKYSKDKHFDDFPSIEFVVNDIVIETIVGIHPYDVVCKIIIKTFNNYGCSI